MSLTHYLYTYDGNLIEDLSPYVQRYQHEHTATGPERASFRIDITDGADISKLRGWYDTMLMMQLQTYDGEALVWSGFIWDVTFEAKGFARQRSMSTVRNRVKVSQQDPDDSTITVYSAWHNHEESQELFGVHEHIEHLNGIVDGGIILERGTGAPARNEDGSVIFEYDWYAQQQINNYAYPLPAYSGFVGTKEPKLSIRAVGRSFIANSVNLSDGWLADSGKPDGTDLRDSGLTGVPWDTLVYAQSTAGDGAYTISHEVRRIVGVINNAAGWLYELNIEQTNDTSTVAGVSRRQGAVDRLRELVKIPNQNGDEYELFIRQDGGVEYRKRTTTPHFFMQPNGQLTHGNGEPVTWRAYVAPIQVVDPQTSMMAGTDLIHPERVAVVNDEARFVPLEWTEADTLANIRAHKLWIAQAGE